MEMFSMFTRETLFQKIIHVSKGELKLVCDIFKPVLLKKNVIFYVVHYPITLDHILFVS